MLMTENAIKTVPTTGKASAIYVNGSLGGGTAKVGYITSIGFVSYKDNEGFDLVLEIGSQQEIRHGQNKVICVNLVSSTGAALDITAYSVA